MINNNYVFNRLLTTTALHRDHEFTAQILKMGGYSGDVTRSLIKSWRTHNTENRHYIPMPDNALVAFIDGLQQASMQGLIEIHLMQGNN